MRGTGPAVYHIGTQNDLNVFVLPICGPRDEFAKIQRVSDEFTGGRGSIRTDTRNHQIKVPRHRILNTRDQSIITMDIRQRVGKRDCPRMLRRMAGIYNLSQLRRFIAFELKALSLKDKARPPVVECSD